MTTPPSSRDTPLQQWRTRTTIYALRVLLVLSALGAVDLLNNLQAGRWLVALGNIAIPVLLIGLLAARRLDHQVQSAALVGIFMAVGALGLLNFGMYGIGPIPLIVAVVLAALLIGPRAALVVGVIAAGGLGAIFAGFASGAIAYPYEPSRHATEGPNLLNYWLLLSGLTVMLTLVITSLIMSLERSLQTNRAALADLEQLNATLDAAVEQRTAELNRTSALLTAIQRVARVGGVAFAHDSTALEWTSELYRIHAVPPDTPIDVALIKQLYPESTWHTLTAAELRLHDEGQPFELELPARTFDGRPIWIRVMSAAEPGDGPRRFIGAVQDITAYKKAQLALAANELKYRTLFTLLPNGVTIADGSGQIVEVNPAAERLLGISAEHHIARRTDDPAWDIVRADGTPFPADELPSIRAPREGKAISDTEMGVLRPDGERTWLSVSAAPLPLDGYGVAVTYIDITERKRAELALAEQLRHAEALARCSQVLLVESVADDNWSATIQRALAALREAIGCRRLALYLYQSPDEIIFSPSVMIADQAANTPDYQPMSYSSADAPREVAEALSAGAWIAGPPEEFYPDDSALRKLCDINQIRSIFVAGLLVSGLYRGHLAASDGRQGWVWSESIVGILRTGLGMIGSFLHQRESTVTLRTRELLLNAAQARQDALLHAIPDLLLGVDAAGTVRFTHVPKPSPLTLTPDVRGRPLAQVLPPALNAALAPVLSRRPTSKPAVTVSLTQPGTGAEITVESRAVAMGKAELLLIVRDITAQRRVQAELERARDAAEAATHAKSAFLASMSHEIRTPLNAVIGMAAMLNATALTDEQRAMVETINTGGQALLAVISDILDFSRIESGHLALDMAPFDLYASINATVDLVGHVAHQKGLRIGCYIDPAVPQTILGDDARLRQVLLNLLGNAVKFTSQGAVELYVSIEQEGEGAPRLTLSVCDTGVGIDPGQIDQIFEPFVQAETSMARRHSGSGLGLTISRQLATLMGGTISVVSAPGVGSTFSLTIPITAAAPTQIDRPSEPTPTTDRPLRILVAEDNAINQEVVGRMLTWLGHQVTLVDNGLSALQAIAQATYDVVLMDIQMPELDGESATRRIRRQGSRIAQPYIIALTANALGGDRERLLAAGMDDYLSKPVLPADLQRALSRASSADHAPEPSRPGEAALVEWPVIEHLAASLGYGQPTATTAIRRLFEEVLPPQIEALATAIDAGDPPHIRTAAHRLRGGCLQMGAQAMAMLCTRIESADADDDPADLLAQLRACYAQTRAQVYQRYLRG